MSFFCYPITNFTCIRINSAREVACDQKWKIDYSTCRFKSTQEELVKKERLAAIDKNFGNVESWNKQFLGFYHNFFGHFAYVNSYTVAGKD